MVPTENRTEEIWARGVIEQNRRWMLAYLFAFTGDAGLAEDLAQEAFLIAYRKRDEFRPGEPFGAWLRGIARNLALRQREARAGARVIFDTDSAWSAFDRRAAELEQAHVDPRFDALRKSALRRCLARLTDRVRRLLEGRYRRGLSAPELARRERIAEGSVPVILHRARAALGDCVRKSLPVDLAGGRP
ncbi:MAG TPA: sigma-70 family RNA polymerase sigma factor [Planctomycetota bacterium]